MWRAGPTTGAATDSTCDGKLSGWKPTYITAWFHDSSVNTEEAQTLREQVRAFNATDQQVQVKLITLPVGDYARQVQAAAAHGGLPDLLDFDGPNLYNYAWSGKLKPIDSCVSQSQREDLLSSVIEQGTYANRLWGIGTFEIGSRPVRAANDPEEGRDPHPERCGRRMDGRRIHHCS